MTAADVARVLEIAASLPESPHWPESAYLDALNPESTPRRIALVAVVSDPAGSNKLRDLPWQACCRRKQNWNRLPWPPGASGAALAACFSTLC